MEQDMIAVLALGVAIFSLMLVQFRGLRAEMVKMRDDHSADLAKMRDDLSTQIGNLRERMAHLEGLMEGLREAVTGARKAA